MNKPIAIIGAGGLGREIAAILATAGTWLPVGFYDDRAAAGSVLLDLPVLGPIAALAEVNQPTAVVWGIANPEVKASIWQRLQNNASITFPVVVANGALLMAPAHVRFGPGTVVMPGAIIGPDVSTGRGCLIHCGCILSHDTHLGHFCTLLQRALVPSGATLGDKVLVAPGAIVQH